MRGSIRKPRRRGVKKVKIDFTAIPSLASETLKGLEYVFLVDLTSFRNGSCNRLLHQMLFGKVSLENQEKIKVYVIMKTKFSPKCRECGIGEKGSTLFIKDRFVHSGDGRVLLSLTTDQGSLDYRKQLSKYIYEHNQNLVILSEDKEYGYKIIGSSVPDDDPESLDYLKYFEMSHIFDQSNADNNNNNNSEGNEEVVIVDTAANEEKVALEDTCKRVEKWIEKRLEKGDEIHLPKTIQSLEKSLDIFCKVSLTFPFQKIFTILKASGDISICNTCQTCKPVSTNTSNQFYFSYKTLNEETSRLCNWMMLHIISEYTKNKVNQVPLKLINLTKSSSTPKRSIKLDSHSIISYLVNHSKLLKINPKQQYISPYSSGYNEPTTTTTTTTTSNYTPKKTSTPLKSKSLPSTPVASAFKKFGTSSTFKSKVPPIANHQQSNDEYTLNSNLFEPSNTLHWIKKEESIRLNLLDLLI